MKEHHITIQLEGTAQATSVKFSEKCMLCKKPVSYDEWRIFSRCHAKCENELSDCLYKEENEEQ